MEEDNKDTVERMQRRLPGSVRGQGSHFSRGPLGVQIPIIIRNSSERRGRSSLLSFRATRTTTGELSVGLTRVDHPRSAKAGGSSSSQPRTQDGGDVSGPPTQPTLGIDFGCTNSVVAILHDGDVEVIPNDIGARTTPSVVHVDLADPDAEQGSPRKALSEEKQVGEAALRLAVTDPDKTVRNIKCILGRTSDSADPLIKHLGSVSLFKVKMNNAIGIMFKDQDGQAHSHIDPEEVAADILHELTKAARSAYGETIGRAVLAVPTYFSAAQRFALKDAATLAGLEVVRLVNETSAAALAYAHGREGAKKVVVVDIGGGGGSVCVAHVEADSVKVLAASPDRLPGGEDFDYLMVQECIKAVKETCGKIIEDARSREILRSSWEKAKQKLSRIPATHISTYLPGIEYEFKSNIRREQFESVCNKAFLEIIDGIKDALIRSKVPVHEVDDVVLVGGSSRIPRLRTLVQEAFGGKALCKAINPDEAVAKGATLLGSGCVELTDILTLPTRVEFSSWRSGTQISSQTSIPCGVRKSAYEPMTGSFTVRQTVDGRSEVVLLQKDSCVDQLTVDISGLLEFNIRKGFYYPPTSIPIPYGCLTEERRNICRRRLSKQRQAQGEEMKRVQSKNTLENILREVLSEPRYKDCEDAASLLEDCKRVLEKLLETPDILLQESASHIENVDQRRTVLNNALAEAAAKARLQETRTSLRDLLHRLVETEVSKSDPVRDLATDFHIKIMKHWQCFKETIGTARLEDLTNLYKEVQQEEENLNAARLQVEAAAEAKRQDFMKTLDGKASDLCNRLSQSDSGSCDLLAQCQRISSWIHQHPDAPLAEIETQSNAILNLEEAWEVKRFENEKLGLELTLDRSMASLLRAEQEEDWVQRFSCIVNDTSQWLSTDGGNITADECQEKCRRLSKELILFEKDLSKHTLALKDSFHKKLLDCMSKFPESYEPGNNLREKCAEDIGWLGAGEGLSHIEITHRFKTFSQQFASCQRAYKKMIKDMTVSTFNDQVNEISRREIHSTDVARDLARELQEFSLKSKARVDSLAEKASVDLYNSFLTDIRERDQFLNTERAARQAATSRLKELLHQVVSKKGGFADSMAAELKDRWLPRWESITAEEASTVPSNVLRETIAAVSADLQKLEGMREEEMAVAALRMHELSESQEKQPDEVDSRAFSPRDEEMAVDQRDQDPEVRSVRDVAMIAMVQLWERVHQAAAPSWELPGESPLHQHQSVMLDCLAEAAAVLAIREAVAAGHMVLLVNREPVSDGELVALSVRYVKTAGPVERLVVVRKLVVGGGEDVLANPFRALCVRAEVAWQDILMGVCTEGAGEAGQLVLKNMRNFVGRPNLPELGTRSTRLDERIALAFQDPRRDAGDEYAASRRELVVTFFSAVETVRGLFAVGGRWWPLLVKECPDLTGDPWATLTKATDFIKRYQLQVFNALSAVPRSGSVGMQAHFLKGLFNGSESDPVALLAFFRNLFLLLEKHYAVDAIGVTPSLSLPSRQKLLAHCVDRAKAEMDKNPSKAEEFKAAVDVASAEWIATTLSVLERYESETDKLRPLSSVARAIFDEVGKPDKSLGPQFSAELVELRAQCVKNFGSAAECRNNLKLEEVWWQAKPIFPAIYSSMKQAWTLPYTVVREGCPLALARGAKCTASCPQERRCSAVMVAVAEKRPERLCIELAAHALQQKFTPEET